MNRLARLPWRLSARALGSSSAGQAIGASAAAWETESRVGHLLGCCMQHAKHACISHDIKGFTAKTREVRIHPQRSLHDSVGFLSTSEHCKICRVSTVA